MTARLPFTQASVQRNFWRQDDMRWYTLADIAGLAALDGASGRVFPLTKTGSRPSRRAEGEGDCMSWHDDSCYDARILRFPDDEYSALEGCNLVEFEIGYEGLARCICCNANRWSSEVETAYKRFTIAGYDHHWRRRERCERWRRLTYPIRCHLYRPLHRVWPRRWRDDEILL